MICRQFEELAPQIAHNELRDAKLLQDAINHAASCAACDAILVEACELAGSVASLSAHDKALDSAAHLEFTLRAAFAREIERAGRRPAPTNAIRPPNVFAGATFRWTSVSLAAAAIILAVIFLPRLLNHNSQSNRAAVVPTQSSSPTRAATSAAPVRQMHLATSHRPKKKPYEPETTLTGFLALPYADDLLNDSIRRGRTAAIIPSGFGLVWASGSNQ